MTINHDSQLYRSGVYLELQKFRNDEKKRGFKLTMAELRALTALTILLNNTDYNGNEGKIKIVNKYWCHVEGMPVISFSWHDYLKYYYSRRDPDNIVGYQMATAKKALYSLCNNKSTIAYYGRNNDGKRQWKRVNNSYIIKVIETSDNSQKVSVMFHPIFIDDLTSFYTLKPLYLYKQIAIYLNTNKIKKATMLFIEWLLTKDEEVITRKREIIIERLWLKHLKKQRHHKRINNTLEECFVTAKGLDYLTEYSSQKDTNELTFVLNPEKCWRVKANKNGKKENVKNKKDSEVDLIDFIG